MNAPNKQELQIVQAFSSISVPEKVIKDSNIKELIQDMLGEQNAVQSNSEKLERLHREKRDGNFFGNWLNDRDDKVQDAQLDLSTSIGRLTQTSSRLLIVNTAISKVLSDQQRILLQQQRVLEEQARELKSQNEKILDQQQQLSEQQKKINAANQGLMEAKGVTQEQAEKLVGCVVRVTEAERQIDLANDLLRTTMHEEMQESLAQCVARVDAGFTEFKQIQEEFERNLGEELAASMRQNQEALASFESQLKMHMISRLGDLLSTINQKTAEQHADVEQQRAFFEHKLQLTNNDLIQRVELVAASMRENQEVLLRSEGQLRTNLITKLDDLLANVNQKISSQHAAFEQHGTFVNHELQQASQDLTRRIDAAQAKQASTSRKTGWAIAAVTGLALLSLCWQVTSHISAG